MEEAIQVFAVIHLTTMGVSHIVRPRIWVDFFVRLREMGEAGVFVIGFLSLIFGSIVVAFHNVWQGVPLVLTLLGWAHVVKALVYFTAPAVGLKGLATVSEERSNRYIAAGIALLLLAGVIVHHLYSG